MSGRTNCLIPSEILKTIDDLSKNLHVRTDDGVHRIQKIWDELYGTNDTTHDRIKKLDNDVKEFWEYQIEHLDERRKNLTKSIEQAGKEAIKLEKALGLEQGVSNLTCGKDVPLVEVEEKVWTLLNSYIKIRDMRLKEFGELEDKEEELCSILNKKLKMSKKRNGKDNSNQQPHIPTSDEINSYREWISELQSLKSTLEHDFESCKENLKLLLKDCDITPITNIERFIFDENNDFSVSQNNLNLLKSTIILYQNKKQEMIDKADQMREEIFTLSKKMFKDSEETEGFLISLDGYSKATLDSLQSELSRLKEERKGKLKELIISHREILNDLWGKCCYTDEQRAQFKPYNAEHWSEEVLCFHEIEIEKLEQFYESNKRIFQLTEKYFNLWDRLTHLEEAASNKNRLFNNRGGRLLKEEKERKTIQKNCPVVKAELNALLTKYKEDTGEDFLHYGEPLQSKIDHLEEQWEISKENGKVLRKLCNEEHLLVESRIGSRPSSANKRKIWTPQQPSNLTKIIKTSAYTTPRNLKYTTSTPTILSSERISTRSGRKHPVASTLKSIRRVRTATGDVVRCDTPRPPLRTPVIKTPTTDNTLSYESFVQHIDKSSSSCSHVNCTKTSETRILRPKNIYNTRIQSKLKTSKCSTPCYKTPKTPFKRPTLKVPCTLTPISPRSVPEYSTSKRILPLIT